MKLLLITFFAVLFFVSINTSQTTDATCPVISITGPSGIVMPGEPFSYRTTIVDGPEKVTYKWSLSNGKILSGQGTNAIQVVTDQPGSSFTATVEIEGMSGNCPNSISDTISQCDGLPLSVLFNEYSEQVWKEERTHFPSLRAEIIRNPNAQIYVIIYFEKNRAVAANTRVTKIKSYFGSLKDRLTFVLQDSEENHTKIYVVPAGANPPTP